MDATNQRKILSILCHATLFFSSTILSIAVPIVLMVAINDNVVKANAKESLNFHLNVWIYGLVLVALALTIINFRLLFLFVFLLVIATLILPIFAIIKILKNPQKPYRYPFIFRLV